MIKSKSLLLLSLLVSSYIFPIVTRFEGEFIIRYKEEEIGVIAFFAKDTGKYSAIIINENLAKEVWNRYSIHDFGIDSERLFKNLERRYFRQYELETNAELINSRPKSRSRLIKHSIK